MSTRPSHLIDRQQTWVAKASERRALADAVWRDVAERRIETEEKIARLRALRLGQTTNRDAAG